MNKHNIFISWSGDRSRIIADAFYEWLPMVVQSVKPWMSSHSIGKGSRGALEMAKALDGTKVGISCLTPENLSAPWILYEAGCLSKTIDDSTRLCTYLLGGLENKDIEPPLAQFQHTSPNKSDTRVLVQTINKAVGGEDPLNEKTLDAIFEQFWPSLEEKLKAFPFAPQPVIKRPIEDMLAEILEFTRAETNRRSIVNYSFEVKDNVPFSLGNVGRFAHDSDPVGPVAFLQAGPTFEIFENLSRATGRRETPTGSVAQTASGKAKKS